MTAFRRLAMFRLWRAHARSPSAVGNESWSSSVTAAKEFRRITQQFARASVPQSRWAAADWHEIHPDCQSDSHAYRTLANRWLVIIWKMWQDRQPYNEAYHLQQRTLCRKPRA